MGILPMSRRSILLLLLVGNNSRMAKMAMTRLKKERKNMRSFLERISSRKFLTALAVQAASVAAIFWPGQDSTLESAAVRIAALITLLLAALGYGEIEASVDSSNQIAADDQASPTNPS